MTNHTVRREPTEPRTWTLRGPNGKVVDAYLIRADAQAACDAANIPAPIVATDRNESDPCERGTVGCCIAHVTGTETECETW